MREETLSDKFTDSRDDSGYGYIKIDDVKDFIKKLKEKLFEDRQIAIQDCKWTCGEIKDIIDKLAGKSLL